MIKITLRAMVFVSAALAIAACAPTDHTAVTEQYKSVRAVSGTEAQRIVAAASIGDFSAIGKETAESNASIVSGVGTAAALYDTGVGFGNAGAIGLGVISFLAAPPPPAAARDATLAVYPASMTKQEVGKAIQQTLLRPYLATLKAEGYVAEPDPDSNRAGQVIFKKPGCDSCLQSLYVGVNERGTTGSNRVFRVYVTNVSKPKSNLMDAAVPWPIKNDYDKAFKAVDKLNGKLALYVAPRKTAEGWSEPMLYYRGKLQPLLTQ